MNKQQEKEIIKDAEDYPLSDSDIQKILNPDTFIFPYPYLKEVRHIDETFDNLGRNIMLYLTENENMGHWVCMIKRELPNGETEIEFFDPYGEAPDTQLNYIGSSKRKELEQDIPLLSRLFRQSGYNIIYNKYPFQKDKADVNTCGRHCVSRLLFKDLDLKQYKKMIDKSGVSPDEFVIRLTHDKLGK